MVLKKRQTELRPYSTNETNDEQIYNNLFIYSLYRSPSPHSSTHSPHSVSTIVVSLSHDDM